MTTQLKRILLAEDNEHDVELTLNALSENRLANEEKADASRQRTLERELEWARQVDEDQPLRFDVGVLWSLMSMWK